MSGDYPAPEYTNMSSKQAFDLRDLLLDKKRWLNENAYNLYLSHYYNPHLPMSKEYLYGLIRDNIIKVVNNDKPYSLTLIAARQGSKILNPDIKFDIVKNHIADKPTHPRAAVSSNTKTSNGLSIMGADNRPYLPLIHKQPEINAPTSSIFKPPNPKKGGGGYKKQHRKSIHKKSTRNNKRKSRKTKRRKTMKT